MSAAGFRAEAVTKVHRNGTRANDGIMLSVEPGEVFGLLGPNGAGKTTLVKQIIGLLRPTSGRLWLDGHDLVADPDAALQLCSYLPQARLPIDPFRVHEAIELTGRIRGGRGPAVRRRTAELIDALDIGTWRDTLGVKLSGGVKRLVGFAMATVMPGALVILDEPTNDVDPLRRRLLWEAIRQVGRSGAGVLLVTHNVLEAERSVDRLAIIDSGKLVAEGTPSALKSDDREHLRLQVMFPPGHQTPELPEWVRASTRVGNNLLTAIDEKDAAAALAWARALVADGAAEEYALTATTLEDIYIRLTGRQSNGDDAGPDDAGRDTVAGAAR